MIIYKNTGLSLVFHHYISLEIQKEAFKVEISQKDQVPLQFGGKNIFGPRKIQKITFPSYNKVVVMGQKARKRVSGCLMIHLSQFFVGR